MRMSLATFLLFVHSSAIAAQHDLTPLQAPTVIVPAPCPYPAFEQPSRLAVWQYYAVDRSGHFRPRVPLTTEPFNRATVQPRIYIPYIFD
jgi:hypothetical protein